MALATADSQGNFKIVFVTFIDNPKTWEGEAA